MLNNHKLLIDKDCPMCRLYGKCFINLGMVDNETIYPYQNASEDLATQINMKRAKSEIALYNMNTQSTQYGIDALLIIIKEKFPTLSRILHHPLPYKMLKGMYAFISNNRKVITPSKINPCDIDCTPEANPSLRWTYIILVAITTGLIVNTFTKPIFEIIGWQHSIVTEIIICFGQVAWQYIAISLIDQSKKLDYLGNMSTVSMAGALVLLPLILFIQITNPDLIIILGCFFTVIGLMFLEHIRRCNLLGITTWMTVSWVTFRTVALILLFIYQGTL